VLDGERERDDVVCVVYVCDVICVGSGVCVKMCACDVRVVVR